jgi:hypothetical protein
MMPESEAPKETPARRAPASNATAADALSGKSRKNNVDAALHALEVFHDLDDVVEIRVLFPDGRVESGYFTVKNEQELRAALRSISPAAEGVYFVPNKIDKRCLSRAKDRMMKRPKKTTTDADVVERRWLYIDVDFTRPSGTSTSDEEHEAALGRAVYIEEYLTNLGFPKGLLCDSGNCAHLYYRLPTGLTMQEGDRLVKRCLEALAAKFNGDGIEIDLKTANRGRVTKLFGTVARKGDPSVERPHRLAAILDEPERIEPVPVDLLEALAADAPQPKGWTNESTNGAHTNTRSLFDIEQWLVKHAIGIKKGPESYGAGGRKWILEVCPFNSDHSKDGPAIIQYANGALQFKCLHTSCGGNGWRQFRNHFEPENERVNGNASAKTAQSQPIEVLSAADLFDGDYPAPKPIIERLMYPGITLLQGAPKEGKSYLALQASIDLVNGYAFAGCFRIPYGKRVVYLALEDTKARTSLRLKQLSDKTVNSKDLHFVYSLAPWPDNLVQLDDLLSRLTADVLVIDTLRAFRMGGKASDRDVVKADYAAIKLIRELADKHGVACLILSHTRKHASGMSDTDASIDSTGISAGVDTLLTLRRRREGTSMLSVLGRETEHNEFELEFDLNKHFGWRVLAEGAEAGLTTVRREIVELLKQMGPLTAKDVAEHLEKQRATVRKQLRSLAENGTLRQDEDGKYFVAAAKQGA